jgi:hypothetical protein
LEWRLFVSGVTLSIVVVSALIIIKIEIECPVKCGLPSKKGGLQSLLPFGAAPRECSEQSEGVFHFGDHSFANMLETPWETLTPTQYIHGMRGTEKSDAYSKPSTCPSLC